MLKNILLISLILISQKSILQEKQSSDSLKEIEWNKAFLDLAYYGLYGEGWPIKTDWMK